MDVESVSGCGIGCGIGWMGEMGVSGCEVDGDGG
jgi:hypothetical protein